MILTSLEDYLYDFVAHLRDVIVTLNLAQWEDSVNMRQFLPIFTTPELHFTLKLGMHMPSSALHSSSVTQTSTLSSKCICGTMSFIRGFYYLDY